MTDKEQEELATALLLVIGGRPVSEIAGALCTVLDRRKWDFLLELQAQMGSAVLYSEDVGYLRDRIGEDYRDVPSRFKEHVTDRMLHGEIVSMHIPDNWGETISYCLDDLIEELDKKGWMEEIPTEVTQDAAHPTK